MKVGTVAAAAAAAVLLLAGGAPGGARAAWEDEAPALRDALAGVDSIIASGAKEAEQLETLPLFARDDEGAKLVALEVGERVAASSARREDPQPAAGAQQQPALVSGSGKPMRPATVVGAPSSRASVVSDASAVFVSDAESSAESAAPRMVVARVARALPIDPHASRLVDPLPLVPAAVGDPRAPQPLRAGLARAERELPTLASNAVPPEALRPTDHLLQDTLSGIKNVEALDVGATRGTAERERLAKLTALARALPGPAPIGESKTAADALRQVGEVAEKLAHRVSALDAQSKGLMEKLYGTSSSRRDEESQEIVRVAQEARARRETEVAQLVRDEVRVLTDKVNMELRGLRGQFLAELRDTLTTLRSSLQKELVRAQEERSRLTAMAAGNLPAGSVDVRDEIALEPQRAMANLDAAIAHQVNSAFNKAQAIAQTVMADRRSAAGAAAAASAAAAAAAPYEPSAKQLSGSIRAQADAARAYDNLVAQAKAANKAAAAAADTISPSAATQAAVAQAAERAMEASESGSPRLFML